MNAEQFYPIFQKASNAVIDSRKVSKGDVFFAFSGENYNAAEQAVNAVAKGALAVIVEQEQYAQPQHNIFYVHSTLQFLQELAVIHRNTLKCIVIGLTGSNGKTTTKEMLNAILSKKFSTQYTFGNLNNHIGVPLTLLSIKPEHEIAVVEIGANHQKEIEFLCSLAQPDFGYITNFGKAHLEGFGGFEGVIKGKSELYDFLINNGKTILVNEKDKIQHEKTADYFKKITFGTPEADYFFEPFSEENFVGISYQGKNAKSNLTGSYNFDNLSAAAALGLHFGITFDLVKDAVENYVPTNMRSQIVQKNGKTLVLDTYNANPSSMAESLKNFNLFEGSKAIVIGDMLELGSESYTEHQNILQLAQTMNFDEIITVGKHFKEVHQDDRSFENVAELSVFLKENPLTSKNILLKASRVIALEKALELIQ